MYQRATWVHCLNHSHIYRVCVYVLHIAHTRTRTCKLLCCPVNCQFANLRVFTQPSNLRNGPRLVNLYSLKPKERNSCWGTFILRHAPMNMSNIFCLKDSPRVLASLVSAKAGPNPRREKKSTTLFYRISKTRLLNLFDGFVDQPGCDDLQVNWR